VDDILTREEITQRYKDEWVLLDDPVVAEGPRVVGGRVVFHSKDRDELDRKMLELRSRRMAVLFTGSIPEGMEILL
jgi:hypothetical protein